MFERLYVLAQPAAKESGRTRLAIVRDLTERMGGSVTAPLNPWRPNSSSASPRNDHVGHRRQRYPTSTLRMSGASATSPAADVTVPTTGGPPELRPLRDSPTACRCESAGDVSASAVDASDEFLPGVAAFREADREIDEARPSPGMVSSVSSDPGAASQQGFADAHRTDPHPAIERRFDHDIDGFDVASVRSRND